VEDGLLRLPVDAGDLAGVAVLAKKTLFAIAWDKGDRLTHVAWSLFSAIPIQREAIVDQINSEIDLELTTPPIFCIPFPLGITNIVLDKVNHNAVQTMHGAI